MRTRNLYPTETQCWQALRRSALRKGNGLLYAAFSTGCISWYAEWGLM